MTGGLELVKICKGRYWVYADTATRERIAFVYNDGMEWVAMPMVAGLERGLRTIRRDTLGHAFDTLKKALGER